MSKENESSFSWLHGLALIGVIGVVSQLAFSPSTRKKILDRDGRQSVLSGATTNLDVCHIDHTKNATYDETWRGRTLTRVEHYLDHYNRHGREGLGLSIRDNIAALRLIAMRMGANELARIPSIEALMELDLAEYL